ncbi:MAG: Stk1 family PASTA domain-containing Ser/Thr kinase [Catonella sp.]|uniref:Stk1 family PASTA domain-containing Ser/Thr kinase n=1 Tax=Catonella sp. TaxID=2382125 RepID=UPI003FA1852E
MLNKGRLIGERYEIISIVGSGGMADVYNATDNRLNRQVAIKVLKEEYGSDKNFVLKFMAEAQSAAGLSHPNIVNVYDVGEDEGLHYIVMELVEGITLKKFIERKGKLELKEAVGIAIQIAQGMEAAHANHIIHRDIKPQNIIISKEGKVKVTDFGIAKAATSNTIAAGQAVGSVHYISPEQARGGYSDEKSDIYSLGVTLYEMISGKMPFAADNMVSVALLHINEEAVPLREIDADIPVSIEKIVQKCMQKKPERRYMTATELISDLRKAVAEPEGDYVSFNQAVVTDSPTINISGEELEAIRKGRFNSENNKMKENVKKHEPREIRELPEDEEEAMDPKIEKLILFGGIAAIVILAAVVIALLVKGFNLFGKSDDSSKLPSSSVVSSKIISGSSVVSEVPSKSSVIVVPAVKGHTLAEAITMLSEAGITNYRFEYKNSREFKKEDVMDVIPAEGSEISRDDEVVVSVSKGDDSQVVPEIRNTSKETAVATLEGMKFVVKTQEKPSDTVEEGKVIETIPAIGTEVKEGDTITVVVSTGPENKNKLVPNVIEKTEEEATKALNEAGFKVSIAYKEDDRIEKGKVISQSIAGGNEAETGKTIVLSISKGPKPVTYTYSTSLTIDENPFADSDESGDIEVKMDQDGKTKTIYSDNLTYDDFPLHIDDITGTSDSEAVCYMVVDGQVYDGKVWRITNWNKAEN